MGKFFIGRPRDRSTSASKPRVIKITASPYPQQAPKAQNEQKKTTHRKYQREKRFSSSVWSQSSLTTKVTSQTVSAIKQKLRWGRFKRISPRIRLATSFFSSQVVIVGMFLLNFYIFSTVLQREFLNQAEKELELMQWTYDIKINQMGFGFRAKIRSASVLEYLMTKNESAFTPVLEELRTELSNRQIEFATLLDSSGHIAVSANNNRSGEHWDPGQLTSLIIQNPDIGQVKFSWVASFSELEKEGIPLYRERMSDDQPLPLTHPADTSADALVRYTYTPILSENNSLLGTLVSGDIANGKTPITFRTVDSYGNGFAGLYMISNTVISRCSSNYIYQIPDSDDKELSARFDPTPAFFLENAFSIEDKSVLVQRYGKWSFAAKRIFNKFSTAGPPTEHSVAPATVVRGVYDGDNDLYETILNQNLVFLLLVIFTDLIMFLISLLLYIRPLEILAKRLRKRKSVMDSGGEIAETFSILRGRIKYLFLLFLPIHIGKSVTLSVLMILSLRNGLRSSQGNTVYAAMGVKNVMYKLKIDQMSFGFAGNTKNTAIRDLLDFPSNNDLLKQVHAVLEAELSVRKIEFAVMVNSNAEILVNPNGVGVNGSLFDPEGLVSLTMKTGLRHKHSAILSYNELINQNVFAYQEHADSSLPSSTLSPLTSKSSSLIRYTTSPIYASSNLEGESPDGVLVSGDIINGKTAFCERILTVMSNGYCGVFIEEGEDLLLITSVYQSSSADDASVTIDSDLPSKDFIKALIEQPPGTTTVQNLFGQQYIFAADSIPKDTYVSSYGEFDVDRDEDFAYVVYASSLKTETGFWLWFGMGVQIFGIVLSGILSLIVTFMAFKPVKKLLRKIGNMKFDFGGKRNSSWRPVASCSAKESCNGSYVYSNTMSKSIDVPITPTSLVLKPNNSGLQSVREV